MASISRVSKHLERRIDRISSLPDELLINILSVLPTKYAVVTSALSKRWRSLNTEVKVLDLDDSLLYDDHEGIDHARNPVVFRGLVDKMLSHYELSESDLVRFRLKCGSHLCDLSNLNSWLHVVLSHGIKELDISIHTSRDVKLPSSIFTCKTLWFVKLKTRCVLDLPESVLLPSLKILHLSKVRFADGESVKRLILGCPLLEEFVVKKNSWSNIKVLSISSPCLRKLKLDFRERLGHIGHRSRVVIDAPLLECFQYVDNLADSYSITRSNAFVEARLYIFIDGDESNDESTISNPAVELIGEISSVKSLFLSDHYIEALTDAEYGLPILPNLAKLELGYTEFFMWEFALPVYFQCAPYLEELIFPEGLHLAAPEDEGNDNYKTDHWERLEGVHSCLKTCLKIIEIELFSALEEELRMVKYLLKHAKVLQQLILHTLGVPEKSRLWKKLMELPRGSKACLIKCM